MLTYEMIMEELEIATSRFEALKDWAEDAHDWLSEACERRNDLERLDPFAINDDYRYNKALECAYDAVEDAWRYYQSIVAKCDKEDERIDLLKQLAKLYEEDEEDFEDVEIAVD
jgi:hypothetical protein